MPRIWKYAAVAAMLWVLPWAVLAEGTENEREEQSAFLFRFRAPAQAVVAGKAPHADAQDHGHAALSKTEFASRQADVRAFWEQHKSSGAPIDRQVVIELYRRSKDFAVVHALLQDTINPVDSVRIGEIRAEIHQQVLTNLYETGRYGDRLGVNDFGTVGNAKSDIDFTPYSDGHPGADLVAAYEAEFKRLTGGVAPGQMDIVAHKHEAIIPDWRQSRATADFVQALRDGRRLLRANPEAYFLEGAYHQQVMGRSAEGKTLTWIERDSSGKVIRTGSNAASDPDFFYFRPDVRARYAWGGAVGNWHFFHAHPGDKVAQAKYLLRSLDDGARLSQLSNDQVKSFQKFEKLSPGQQRRIVTDLYGGRVGPEVVQRFVAVMQTAAKIRDLKAVGGATDSPDAYRSMIELERQANPDMSEDGLLERAKRSVDQHGAAMLLENNIIASESRLNDWLAPKVDSGEFRTVGSNGKLRKIVIDRGKIKRLQMSAFFELRDGIEMLPDSEIGRIKRDNPRFARDIEILRGVIETQRQMMVAPEHLSADAARQHRMSAADKVLSELGRLDAVIDQGGPLRFYSELGRSAWQHGQQFEDWSQAKLVDALGYTLSGGNKQMLPLLNQMREATKTTNERLMGARWMARLDKANAVVEVLKAYVSEGEFNTEVAKVAFYQAISYIPGVGTVMQVQGGMQGVITLASTQIIPGYGPILITLQLAKGTVELAGLAVFEPLRDDRELLAYQGYLDAGGSGLITTGQAERFEGQVTPVLHVINSDRSLSLDERRARIYHYFHDDITRTLEKDPNFPFTEDEWPREWMAKEQEWLGVRTHQYVLHWWNATGPFDSYDEILAFRAKTAGLNEEEFRSRIKSRLWRDYWKGRELAMQQKIVEVEAQRDELETKMAQIAAVDVGLTRRKYEMRADFESNGEMIYAKMLDGMPVLEPTLQIIAAPTIETLELEGYEEEEIEAAPMVNLRANVYASTKDHPLPWSISWEVRQGGESKQFDWGNASMAGELQHTVGESSGPWPVDVVAVARDAEDREIVRQTVDLAVEKIEIGRTTEEDDDEEEEAEVAQGDDGEDEGDGVGGDENAPDPLADAGPVATAAAETATAACQSATDQAAAATNALGDVGAELGGLEGDIAAARAAADRLEELAQRAQAAADMANGLATGIAALRDESALLRDALCSPERRNALADLKARLRAILFQADGLMDAIQDAAADARGARAEAASVVSVDDLRARLAGAFDRVEAARDALERAGAAADQAAAAAAQIEEQRSRAAAAVAGGSEGDDPGGTSAGSAQAAYGAVAAAADTVGDCPAEARATIDDSRAAIDETLARASAAAAALDEIAALSTRETLQRIEQSVQEAETTEAIADAFFDSIANRVEAGTGCTWDPSAETDPDPDTPGSGWSRSDGGGWSASEVETVEGGGGTGGRSAPAEPEPPAQDPRIEGWIRQATDAFNNCDYATAKQLADQIAAVDPNHPWLAENYRRILDADRMRRGALRALREAEAALNNSRGSVEDLRQARAAAHRAALAAPPCMVDTIDGLVHQVDDAIIDAMVAEQERHRQERRENAGRLAGAIGSVIGTIAAVGAATQGIDIGNLPTGIPGLTLPVPTGGGTTPVRPPVSTGGGGGSGGGSSGASECTPSRPCCDIYDAFGDTGQGQDEPYQYWVWELGGQGARSYTPIGLPVEGIAERQAAMKSQIQGRAPAGSVFRWHGPYGSHAAAVAQTRRLCPNPIQLPAWAQRMRGNR